VPAFRSLLRLGGLSWQITDSFPEREEAKDFFDLGTAGQVAPKSPAQLGGGGFVIDGGTQALPFRPGSVGREDFCRHRQFIAVPLGVGSQGQVAADADGLKKGPFRQSLEPSRPMVEASEKVEAAGPRRGLNDDDSLARCGDERERKGPVVSDAKTVQPRFGDDDGVQIPFVDVA
jgi:hypothetical protein